MTDTAHIRNFSIIAHIDHGKSTLADRLIQLCGAVSDRDMVNQILDSMDLERERGITIKANTVRLDYTAKNGEKYVLNLIDTPGHVDFAYEVSRSLAACEGSLLVVDASQGVEAQTLANVYQAINNNHEIVPVLNKVDLPAADAGPRAPADRGRDRHRCLGCDSDLGQDRCRRARGAGSHRAPPAGAQGRPQRAARRRCSSTAGTTAYLGVVVLVRIIDGVMKKGQKVKLMSTNAVYQLERVGVSRPKKEMVDELGPGEIGFFTASIKQVADTRVGDTVVEDKAQAVTPLPGFRPAQSVVFAGFFPVDAARFEDLREAMGKLRLNDASFSYDMETSAALGFGFRCGFLGLLHLEIIRERIEREFNVDIITTAPSVIYKVNMRDGTQIELHNPVDLPDQTLILSIEEPWIEATILVPDEYLGSILKLCEDRRGRQKQLTYAGARAMLVYELAAQRGGVRLLRPAQVGVAAAMRPSTTR